MSSNEHSSKELQGKIVNVQHFCLHDGEGIRTVIFFKGCPLRCKWCSNPETQKQERELACYRNLCNGCMQCLSLCEQHALLFKGKHIAGISRNCQLCEHCAENCSTHALKVYGKTVTIAELLDEIKTDQLFYTATHGGVTLSGGEVLQQTEFAVALLKACKESGIHTTVETCCYGAWEAVEQIAKWADELYIDVKHMNASLHKLYTGVSNELILSNIQRLSQEGYVFTIRIPIIPGINDDDNLIDTFAFVHKLKNCKRIGLIPYHKYGVNKYDALGKNYQLKSLEVPDEAFLSYFKMLCTQHFRIPCEIGW